ncbi:PREDICTED: uncharacterized protein LOC104599487 [Nelumbo nucifera]|uniref:Uncharacterized protein LOC104599487 n=2 Tax=Nelumbo nucifera TaxID=4432 RepID=A0A1U8ADQ7_NELNU|nr:PREDICTED: uncharacterized protein LOC104599487 [Nelumbo nucifera]DAD22770.1 TPA_asm: hypothetical protein HUJ06_024233 [Nelumbo nucifera]
MRFSQSSTGSPAEGRAQTSPSLLPQSRHFRSGREHSRARKKHKRLDAICEKEYNRHRVIEAETNEVNAEGAPGNVDAELRRSSRVRRAPVLLDVSPPPVKKRRKIHKGGGSQTKKNETSGNRKQGKDCSEQPSPVPNSEDLEQPDSWKSRLRSRAKNVYFSPKEKDASPLSKRRLFDEPEESKVEEKVGGGESNNNKEGLQGAKSPVAKSKKPGKAKGSMCPVNEDQATVSCKSKENSNEENVEKRLPDMNQEGASRVEIVMEAGDETIVDDSSTQVTEKDGDEVITCMQLDKEGDDRKDLETVEQCVEQLEQPGCEKEGGNSKDAMSADAAPTDPPESVDCHPSKDACPSKSDNKPSEDVNVERVAKSSLYSTETFDKPRFTEGRRCGLCGGGIDGKPPKKLVPGSNESDNEAYGGASASEEPNYDIWDGFGDEPGWLGRLLGPIHDRYGIAGVWVHQHCAVWSPEVYFAGLGRLKNVRAALFRGRVLKCSRCGRPGATIGCRVDRCPKTYHLPCARSDGCIFDHRKFLIACTDHRHLFQPYGNQYLHRMKKMKLRKMKLELRKQSHDAWRKDFEAEEKWLENCGEDEEFVKREGKRLHRDLLRIAPVYIGGSSSESEKLYQGWESVAGLQNVIQCLKEVVILPLLYPEFFSNLGLTPPRGVLLHGYPGTGKTLVVRALIGSCARGDKQIAYFARKGADCLGKYVGDAERQLRLLFQVAERSQPSIIFFDEIDGLAPRRTRQQDQTHSSVVSTLLALLDGLKSRGSVIVIGATNRPDAVDPALRRPGRFDREIYFPLPSMKDRAAILSLHTQRWPKSVSGSLLKWVARQTTGFAGADLQALCTQAAMNALKRNCALQDILLSAEKKIDNGNRLPLPSFVVEERDWLSALECSPPPCSRREAGMAVNDVVSSPLYTHLIPCLLQPLSYLLVSLYLDERINLPPCLSKAVMSIKGIVFSALEKRKLPGFCWRSCLHDLIWEEDIAREIERNLSCAGLLIGVSNLSNSTALNGESDDDNETVELCASSHLGLQNASYSSRMGITGFRILIAGGPGSGQRHLASCLLHGFAGDVEIQKVNLATMSQEGHGDMVQGLTQILLRCASIGSCIIYMPRLDSWAMETDHQVFEEENDSESDSCRRTYEAAASQAWNSFVEQVDSMFSSSSLMILATSEVSIQDLPPRIGQFFTSDILNCNDQVLSEHTIPRFVVEVDGIFNRDTVINSSVAELSCGLVQQYVQLVHHRVHLCSMSKQHAIFDTNKENISLNTDNGASNDRIKIQVTSVKASNGNASSSGHQILQYRSGDKQQPLLKTNGHPEDEMQFGPQDSVPRIPLNSRTLKGKSSLLVAISTFGYQILRYPHFAELCWVTSKLKEGPCADINGPWKGWPFNSCIIRPNNLLEKVSVGGNSSSLKNKENFGLVRGLIAIGLLAYKGVYSSVREVSFEVRKVLELLVGQVNSKIQGGKDRYRFIRLLSQVAYLDDMVNSWAYMLQSLEDGQISVSNPRPATMGLSNDQDTSVDCLNGDDACKQNLSSKSCIEVEVKEDNPWKLVADKIECAGFKEINKGIVNPGLVNSEVIPISGEASPQKMVLPGHSSAGIPKESNPLVSVSVVHEQSKVDHTEHCSSGDLVDNARLCGDSLKKSNGLVAEPVLSSEEGVWMDDASKQCNGSLMPELGHSSEDSECKPDEPTLDINSTLDKAHNLSTASGISCLYECCPECIHSIHSWVQNVLIHEQESYGSCWTVEDVHNVVVSLSANLFSTVRKFYFDESVSTSEKFEKTLRHDCHEHQAVDAIKLKKSFCQCISSGNRVIMPMECICHSRSRDVTAITNACTNSQFGLNLKFFFRDSVLVPVDPDKDVLFHCKFQNLCLCSLIESISMSKSPLG